MSTVWTPFGKPSFTRVRRSFYDLLFVFRYRIADRDRYVKKIDNILRKDIKVLHFGYAVFVDKCRKIIYTITMNNEFNEYATLVADRTFRHTAERLVMLCGIRADLKGFDCLIDAVILYGVGNCNGFCEIYRVIGELKKLKPKSVMREISYAIDQSYDIHEKLSAFIGIKIKKTDIHNGFVIAYLGKIFRNPDLSLYA